MKELLFVCLFGDWIILNQERKAIKVDLFRK